MLHKFKLWLMIIQHGKYRYYNQFRGIFIYILFFLNEIFFIRCSHDDCSYTYDSNIEATVVSIASTSDGLGNIDVTITGSFEDSGKRTFFQLMVEIYIFYHLFVCIINDLIIQVRL